MWVGLSHRGIFIWWNKKITDFAIYSLYYSQFIRNLLFILFCAKKRCFVLNFTILSSILWHERLYLLIALASQLQRTSDLGIGYKFQLDTSTRSWEKGNWQTNGRTEQSDPIMIPFFSFLDMELYKTFFKWLLR